MWQYNYSYDYLCHYGILGMKWGVRRYQNKDGTLTPAGRERLRKKIDETKSKHSATYYSSEIKQYEDEIKKVEKEGYKKWANDNYYDDYSDSDQKQLWRDYLKELRTEASVSKIFMDNAPFFRKKTFYIGKKQLWIQKSDENGKTI